MRSEGDPALTDLAARAPAKHRAGRLDGRWRGARKHLKRRLRRLTRSSVFMGLAATTIHGVLRFIVKTQKPVADSSAWNEVLHRNHPAIVGLWHGQHLLAPFFRPKDLPFVALLSKNADAEVNARVVERFGIGTIRGSGGREPGRTMEKGGARALIALRRRVLGGEGVCMIADISKSTAREAGLGIVTLAKITGRPIVPSAAATSRRHVLQRSWDRTTIPLPFGRMAVVMEEPIFVPADADAALLEAKRREVTVAIESANRRATALVSRDASA